MDITVTEEPDRQRFVAHDGAERVGVLDYQVRGDVLALTHTGVDPARRGGGIATVLVTRALDAVRDSGRRIVPVCPFVDHVLRLEPRYADLVAGDRAQWSGPAGD
ncbi:N-acetyltransferase [Pilimelia anulata]|uniref:N-acetyltransferase n=1 Tax=Pilimelia anulata TaxID=53371 RepID=A0A8J3F9E8_9ACTN|nr:GNAT family N-acetyltransferase [Pilimelia anulata]GGJ86083.1 N-acetyltransferase [Pilimelia anulata]